MSETIPSLSAHRTMWKALSDKVYRHAYALAHVGDFLAMQVHSLRAHRGWTQKRLALESGHTQPQISNFETNCENVNLATLHKLAEAFDVALIVKFVPFSEMGRESMSARADIAIPSYEEEAPDAISYPIVTTSGPQMVRFSRARNGSNHAASPYFEMADVSGTRSRAVGAI